MSESSDSDDEDELQISSIFHHRKTQPPKPPSPHHRLKAQQPKPFLLHCSRCLLYFPSPSLGPRRQRLLNLARSSRIRPQRGTNRSFHSDPWRQQLQPTDGKHGGLHARILVENMRARMVEAIHGAAGMAGGSKNRWRIGERVEAVRRAGVESFLPPRHKIWIGETAMEERITKDLMAGDNFYNSP